MKTPYGQKKKNINKITFIGDNVIPFNAPGGFKGLCDAVTVTGVFKKMSGQGLVMDGEMELEPCAINNVLLNCDPYLVWPGVMLEWYG